MIGAFVRPAAAAAALLAVAGCGEQPSPAASAATRASTAVQLQAADAFPAFLERERRAGRGVVVNQWASWCRPCRQEFPLLTGASRDFAGRVTFAGVLARDSAERGRAFLTSNPVGFVQFHDPDLEVSRSFRGGRVWPTTAFYTPSGRLNIIHQGPYTSAEALAADVRRYATDG